ncbi:MAG: ferritin family protein [Thermofilaceae archaeon]
MKHTSEIPVILGRLSEAESNYAEELRKLASSIRYTAALSAIFTALSKDSEKHAELYESLLKIMGETAQPRLFEEDLKLVSDAIDRHIETEKKMIEESRKLLDKIEDSRIRLLLAAIYEDEVKHHKLLVDVKDKIAKIQTFTEEEFWDAVWRDSPWHGTPGG